MKTSLTPPTIERPLILGIESSCDDTACAVLDGRGRVLSSVVSSQMAAHQPYGGVVPEIASREHLRNWPAVRAEALLQAGVSLPEIDVVAATRGPGLVGSLLVGLSVGKAIAYGLNKPFFGVHHLEGHLFSPFLVPPWDKKRDKRKNQEIGEHEPPAKPSDEEPSLQAATEKPAGVIPVASPVPDTFTGLVVSGGHTALYSVQQTVHTTGTQCSVETICETRDDAMGECFDKVGKRLGLPFPGGPTVDRLAELASLEKGRAVFRRMTERRGPGELYFRTPRCGTSLDFSYSGLKTQAMVEIERLEQDGLCADANELLQLSRMERERGKQAVRNSTQYDAIQLLAAFRDAAVRQVLDRLRRHHKMAGFSDLAVSGGVAANRALRRAVTQWGQSAGVRVHLVPLAFCGDNAAMIAHAALRRFARGEQGDPLATDARSRLAVR